MKSAVALAIRTNHFPEYTYLLKKVWSRACQGLPGYHFKGLTEREKAILRGWSVNHSDVFYFTTTHDLCDASFTKGGLEKMVRTMYAHELLRRIEHEREFEAKHTETAGIPTASKPLHEKSLDEYIFIDCDPSLNWWERDELMVKLAG
jgi:hypothetical protein